MFNILLFLSVGKYNFSYLCAFPFDGETPLKAAVKCLDQWHSLDSAGNTAIRAILAKE